MPVVTPTRASMASQNAVPYCEVFSAVFGHGEADQAGSVFGHEVDGFGRDLLSRERDVAFVLSVFIVDDDDHASGANLFDRGGDVGEGLGGHDSLLYQVLVS